MADNSKERDEAIERAKKKVDEQVKEHKDEDRDLQDAVGGAVDSEIGDTLWEISYKT